MLGVIQHVQQGPKSVDSAILLSKWSPLPFLGVWERLAVFESSLSAAKKCAQARGSRALGSRCASLSSCFARITVHRHPLRPRGLIPRPEPSRCASWRLDATFAVAKVSAITISICAKTQAVKDESTQRRFAVAWMKRRVSVCEKDALSA